MAADSQSGNEAAIPLVHRPPRRVALGRFPTAVQHLPRLSAPTAELWVKRDDRSHEVYGGNKVRKLERLLGQVLSGAVARGAGRVVTAGAVGSHHVLATAYFGRRVGLQVEAVVFPQPRTDHVAETLRAGAGLGARFFPVRSVAAVPLALASRALAGAHVILPGGSSLEGAMAYVDAARELAAQVRRGELPEPDVCVVALGSGGTAAGLAAGFAAEGLATRVVGVCVLRPAWALGSITSALARACARRAMDDHAELADRDEVANGRPGPPLDRRRLAIDDRFVGRGYGFDTDDARRAQREALEAAGLVLDPTYTGKAFAAAQWYVRARQARRVLFWNTLSSAPMDRLLDGAPAERDLPPSVRALLKGEPGAWPRFVTGGLG